MTDVATPTTTADKLEHWRSRLTATGLPVFSRTVREIGNVSSSKAASAQDLSDVIGHDASMAARVIRIANSSLFNLQNRDIDTINAAVVMVGFDAVRDLAISVSVIEEMLKGHKHARLGKQLARAFHAAAQARSFAKCSGDNSEEVFVGALLKHVGEMAFWSRAEGEAEDVEAEILRGTDAADAERQVLGFELSQLSQVLAEEWCLGDLVTHVLNGHHFEDRQVQHVELAHELAEVLDLHKWGSKEAREVMGKLAKHLDMKVSDVEKMVCQNLDEAVAIAERFGVPKIEDTLPEVPPATLSKTAENTVCTDSPENEYIAAYDGVKLLDVLNDIADSLEQGASRDELMRKVVNGVHEALGLELAYFALFSPDRLKLLIKYAASRHGVEALLGLARPADESELFSRALADKKVILFNAAADTRSSAWHSGGAGAVVAVSLGSRSVGVLYGEAPADSALGDDQAAGFRQLGQQIGMILAQAAQ
jgi:HD-like signal output (HDOD) protein